MIDLQKIRTEAAQVPDSRLKSETRSRMRKHPPRGRGKWLSAGLVPGQKYTLEVWGNADFPPRQLLEPLVALVNATPRPRAASRWKGQEEPTILIPTGLSADASKPDQIRSALRMLLSALVLLDHVDHATTELSTGRDR
jgi:hypothetical protein